MTSIRRELRIKFEEILHERYSQIGKDYGVDDLAKELADSALELRGFQFPMPKDQWEKEYLGTFEEAEKPAFDMSKAGMEWQILADAEITQGQLDTEKLTKEVIDAFESAFGIERPWNWYPAKPSEARTWADFREYLTKLYVSDHDCFTKYFTWAAQPYSRGAMSTLGIKRNPQDFPDSWAAFCASAMYSKPRKVVADSERTDLDDGGTPMSYG